MKAIIFPGQGIQKQGMGRDLYYSMPEARAYFDIADEIAGRRLTELMFNGPEAELSRSLNAQPAIFVYQVALASCQRDVVPDVVAGHSFGEFAALVIAGCLTFDDALRLVLLRAELSSFYSGKPIDSAMAAVIGLDESKVLDVLANLSSSTRTLVYVANFNGPGQLVLSGARSAVKDACVELKKAGAKKVVVLPIEGAFHTPLVMEIELELAKHIRSTAFKAPRIPIFQCADSSSTFDADEVKRKLLSHPTSSVNWTLTVRRMVSAGVVSFVEAGTDDTLQKIAKRMFPNLTVTSLLYCEKYRGKIKDYSI